MDLPEICHTPSLVIELDQQVEAIKRVHPYDGEGS